MRSRRFLALLTAGALVVGLPAASVAAGGGKTVLHGSAPAWANSKNLVAAVDPTTPVAFRVYLGWRGDAAAYARAVSDPKSPSYGKYLTPAQFHKQFSPTQAQVGAVQQWLHGQGFTLEDTPANNHYVAVSGTVAQAQAAFGVSIDLYKVRGQLVVSQNGELSIPTDLATAIEGVVGLDDSAEFVQPDTVVDPSAFPGGFRNAGPLSDYWAQYVSDYAYPSGYTAVSSPAKASWTLKGYTPQQIKSAYGIPGTYDGAGQSVAVIDAFASPTLFSDVNQWSANRGLPTMSHSQFVQIVAPGITHRATNKNMKPAGWSAEQALDVEIVHGMAPAAKIVFVSTPNNRRDLDAGINHVVDMHLADIATNSYGYSTELLPPGFVKSVNDTLIQGAIEGIGIYFSSGDNGDETARFGFATTDFPSSSPWVTSVGGTALAVGQDGSRVLETGWGTSNYNCDSTTKVCTRSGWLYGAGGGVSRVFARPWYQTSFGLTTSGRAVPDVSAVADPQTGLLIGLTQYFPGVGLAYGEYRIGGTSLSSPLVAGLMALANQKHGSPLGFANPLFYANAGQFTDILSVKTAVARRNFNNSIDATNGTADKLRTFDDYSGSPTQSTHAGWDDVTGLGVPNGIFTKP